MTDTQPAHSKLGASSMYRWAACPGSVRLSQGIENVSSAYADEGTQAHEFAAHCLAKQFAIEIPAYVTDDMRLAVLAYVEFLDETFEPGDIDQVEVRFDLSKVHPGCFGTADHVRWRPSTKTLYVTDYKHGAGIPVEVRNNPQLRYYALGALTQCGYPAEKVVMRIVQPRCDHADGPIREEEIDAIDLLDFRSDLRTYAKATEAGDAPLSTGDHCRFCPAGRARKCPAIESGKSAAVKRAFSAVLPYDPAELTKALDSRPVVEAWLKNLDEFAYAEAEAGRYVGFGYKLVDKRATRKFVSEGDVVQRCQEKGFGPDDYYTRKLLSPAQLEKVVGKKVLDDLIISESSGHVLVPDSDKRPAISRQPVQDAFTLING